ncbi:hypothetical protein [Paenibacillus thiaminolyticus]|uniref:hypothetical protein n=1 Tax=Paenibacillus thiaminolyticus TaxID=49283 RepID=UPI002543B2B0|nr:hypothetical protein [Paenibacillus thiaminolyticus]WII39833.1 hypothetical protein O0V01_12410 [Paenibacillus thiaminolyticus]
MLSRKKGWIAVIAAAIVIGALFVVPVTLHPPDSTRIILEHTYQTYITPPCYDRAEVTNNLAEGALKHLKDYPSYSPESACTRDSLEPQKATAIVWLGQMMGISKGPWDW